jgi:anti-sigma B factor antagonist
MIGKSSLEVSHTNAGQEHIIKVSGELDLSTVDTLRQAAEEHLEAGQTLILDLSGLTFCDSTGLGAMIRLHQRADTTGATLILCELRRRVTELLAVTGVDQVLKVYPTVQAARAALSAQ